MSGADTVWGTHEVSEECSKKLLETDVLVVGASLAGLAAAETAARGGARTVLVDAAPEVGARPNPANVIMEPLWPDGCPIPQDTVVKELSGVRVAGPSGTGPVFRFRSFVVDRRRFDQFYEQRARNAGADVRSGVRVEGSHPSGGVRTDQGDCLSRVTIYADGPRSPVITEKKLLTMENPDAVAWGLDQLLRSPDIGESEMFEVRFGSFATGWRAQLNPIGGDLAHLWTFARGVDEDVLKRLALQARRHLVAEGSAVQVVKENYGKDPAFVASRELVKDGVMACGAAAAQGGVENGARAGMLAGEVAAEAVRRGDVSRAALIRYEDEWLSKIKPQQFVLTHIIGRITQLPDKTLDRIFEPLDGAELDEHYFRELLKGEPRALIKLLRSAGYINAVRALIPFVSNVCVPLAREWVSSRQHSLV